MRETAWRTDEPCPVCGTGLVLVDDGRPVLRAECRLCGYAGLAEAIGAGLMSPDELQWRPRLVADLDNLRAAVGWAFDMAGVDVGAAQLDRPQAGAVLGSQIPDYLAS